MRVLSTQQRARLPMGKKKFNELLGAYVAKPPGKLALVPESDPREPVDLTSAPDQEFSVLPDEE